MVAAFQDPTFPTFLAYNLSCKPSKDIFLSTRVGVGTLWNPALQALQKSCAGPANQLWRKRYNYSTPECGIHPANRLILRPSSKISDNWYETLKMPYYSVSWGLKPYSNYPAQLQGLHKRNTNNNFMEHFCTSMSLYKSDIIAVGQYGAAYVFKKYENSQWRRTLLKEPAGLNETTRSSFGQRVSMSEPVVAVSGPGKAYVYQNSNLQAQPTQIRKPQGATASFGSDVGLSLSGQHLFVSDSLGFKKYVYTRTSDSTWSAPAVFDVDDNSGGGGGNQRSPFFAGETFAVYHARNDGRDGGNISFYDYNYSSRTWIFQFVIDKVPNADVLAVDETTLVLNVRWGATIAMYERQPDNQSWIKTQDIDLKTESIGQAADDIRVGAAVQNNTVLFGVVAIEMGKRTNYYHTSSMIFLEKSPENGTWVRTGEVDLRKLGLEHSGVGYMLQMGGDTIAAGLPPQWYDSSNREPDTLGVVYMLSKQREMAK